MLYINTKKAFSAKMVGARLSTPPLQPPPRPPPSPSHHNLPHRQPVADHPSCPGGYMVFAESAFFLVTERTLAVTSQGTPVITALNYCPLLAPVGLATALFLTEQRHSVPRYSPRQNIVPEWYRLERGEWSSSSPLFNTSNCSVSCSLLLIVIMGRNHGNQFK